MNHKCDNRQILVKGHTFQADINAIDCSLNGQQIVVALNYRLVIYKQLSVYKTLNVDRSRIISVRYSPDSKLIVFGYEYGPFSLRIWDWKRRVQLCILTRWHCQFRDNPEKLGLVSFSGDGQNLVYESSNYNVIRLWDWKIRENTRQFLPKYKIIGILNQSISDQKMQVAVRAPKGIRIIDLMTEKVIQEINLFNYTVSLEKQYQYQDLYVLTSKFRSLIRVWKIFEGLEITSIRFVPFPHYQSAKLSQDSKFILLISEFRGVRIWNVKGKKMIRILERDKALKCTASYLRLWALSLAHSQLASVFFQLTLADSIEEANVATMLIGFPVFLLATLGVLLIMDAMECFLHSLRLHWVEFQGKFFKGEGTAFDVYSFSAAMKD